MDAQTFCIGGDAPLLSTAEDFTSDRDSQEGYITPSRSRKQLPNQNAIEVLEQCSTYCLIREESTRLYYLCDSQSRHVLLKTADWAKAYRSWLDYRAQPFDVTPETSDSALHDLVSQNQDNPCFGQLLYSCDRRFQGTLQYLVRLSETTAMCWTPTSNQPVALGQLTVETLGQRRHRPSKWVEPQSAASMVDALHRSIRGLHRRCQYNLYQFNSEHWARLITTGQSYCFQKDDLYVHWLDHPQSSEPRTPPAIWEENLDVQVLLIMAITP
jgi:hypothetical protein